MLPRAQGHLAQDCYTRHCGIPDCDFEDSGIAEFQDSHTLWDAWIARFEAVTSSLSCSEMVRLEAEGSPSITEWGAFKAEPLRIVSSTRMRTAHTRHIKKTRKAPSMFSAFKDFGPPPSASLLRESESDSFLHPPGDCQSFSTLPHAPSNLFTATAQLT